MRCPLAASYQTMAHSLTMGAWGFASTRETLAVDFALLYPPYAWITAPAVMTEEVCLRSCHTSGRAEGLRPSAFFCIPQEWGIKGVDGVP